MYGITSVRYYSPDDGVTFLDSNLGGAALFETGIATDGLTIVAMVNASDDSYYYSSDGKTWLEGHIGFGSYWISVTYGNGVFVAAPSNSTQIIARSTDGINWTQETPPYAIQGFVAMAGDGVLVVMGYGLLWSSDGVTWNNGAGSIGVAQQGVFGKGMFVCVNDGTSTGQPNADYSYSSDGKSWTQGTLPVAGFWNRIAYGNGVFVITSSSSYSCLVSSDGLNWTEYTMPNPSPGNNAYYDAITFSGDQFIATNNNSSYNYECAVSSEGVNWSLSGGVLDGGSQWLGISFAAPTSQMFVLT